MNQTYKTDRIAHAPIRRWKQVALIRCARQLPLLIVALSRRNNEKRNSYLANATQGLREAMRSATATSIVLVGC